MYKALKTGVLSRWVFRRWFFLVLSRLKMAKVWEFLSLHKHKHTILHLSVLFCTHSCVDMRRSVLGVGGCGSGSPEIQNLHQLFCVLILLVSPPQLQRRRIALHVRKVVVCSYWVVWIRKKKYSRFTFSVKLLVFGGSNTLCVDHVTPVLYIFPDFP